MRVDDRANTNKVYKACYCIIKSPYTTAFIVSIIVANTVTLALDSYPTNIDLMNDLDKVNTAFSMIFIIEMIIKIIGLGFKACL